MANHSFKVGNFRGAVRAARYKKYRIDCALPLTRNARLEYVRRKPKRQPEQQYVDAGRILAIRNRLLQNRECSRGDF